MVGFTKLVRETGAGAEVDVRILRDGEAQTISLTLGLRPRAEQDADEYEDETFGITIRELTTDVRIRMNLGEEVQGVIVRSVESGSVAQAARVVPGTVILRMNDMVIGSIEDYKAAVEQMEEAQPSEVTVFARVGSVTGFFRFQPRWEIE